MGRTQPLLPQQLLLPLLLQATVVVVVVQGGSLAPSVYDYYDFLEIPRAQPRSDDPSKVAQFPAQRGPRYQPNSGQFKPSPLFKPSPPYQAPFKPKPVYRERSKAINPYFQPKNKPRYQEIGGFRRPVQSSPNIAQIRPNPAFSRQKVPHFASDVTKTNFKPIFSPNQGERPPLAQEWLEDSSNTPYYYQEEEEEGDSQLFPVYEEDGVSPQYTEEAAPFLPRYEKRPLTPIYEGEKASFRPKHEENKPIYPSYEAEEDREAFTPRYEEDKRYRAEFLSPSRDDHTYRPVYEERNPVHSQYRENRPIEPQYKEEAPSHSQYKEDRPSYPEYRAEPEGTHRESTPDYPRYEVDDNEGRFRPVYRENVGLGGREGYKEEEEAPVYPYKEELDNPRQRGSSFQPVFREENSGFRPSIQEERRRKEEEETVIEKREVPGDSVHLDANGREFVAEAARVEGGEGGDGRLAFQIHGQQGPHSYRFGYDTGKGYNRQFRYEERGADGQVHGRYGFYDKDGKLQIVNYSAHPKHGFSADVPHN